MRRGFTLVELMVVISIIALIASFLLAGLWLAQNSARDAKTKALIAKIDGQLALRWEAYQTRPVPEDPTAIAGRLGSGFDASTPAGRAKVILYAKREMMRLEMPERWQDMQGKTALAQYPALAQRFQAHYQSLYDSLTAAQREKLPLYESSECLYLILTTSMPGAPSARHMFRADDLADTDGDGAMEIVDAWGQPIRFLRWAPGASQALEKDGSVSGDGNSAYAAAVSDIQSGDAVNDHDPLDPMKTQSEAYALYPIVWSLGPSGAGDLNVGKTASSSAFDYNAIKSNPFDTSALPLGRPLVTDAEHGGKHYDNIHNHLLNAQ